MDHFAQAMPGCRMTSYSFAETSAPIKNINFHYDPQKTARMFVSCFLNPKKSEASSFVDHLIQANMVEPVLEVVGQFSGLSVARGVNMISGEGIAQHHPNILLVEQFLIGVIRKSPRSWAYDTLPPFNDEAPEASLFGMMMWDGWLKQDPNLSLEERKDVNTLRHSLMSVPYQMEQRDRDSDCAALASTVQSRLCQTSVPIVPALTLAPRQFTGCMQCFAVFSAQAMLGLTSCCNSLEWFFAPHSSMRD